MFGVRLIKLGKNRRASALLGGVLVLCTLGLACQRENPRIRELTTKASQADDAAQQLRRAWLAQLARLPPLGRGLPGHGGLSIIPFTPEQIRFLQTRINGERDVSRKALIQEALVKDQEIRVLSERLEQLKRDLPTPDVAESNDSHYGLALRFLRNQGVPEDQAKKLISLAPILGRLDPGFEVYHFLVNGQYATWVAQGSSPRSPRELNRLGSLDESKAARERARTHGDRLNQTAGGLLAQKRALEMEISELRVQQAKSLEEQENLQKEETASVKELNSLHYLVASRTDLESTGIVTLPLLGRSQAGPNWQDSIFNRHLDLRRGRVIQIQAKDLGLERIGSVAVIPGSYLENVHFRLIPSPDHQTVTVELLVLSRFWNDKVVFAVSR